jgi:HD-like signal output (HDOD) protein
MGSLPSLPSLYLQLTEELRSPDVSASRISQIVSKDLAMTSKILQIVNSAYFGLSRQISSIERAILLMGLEMLRSFVLSVEVFSMFEAKKMAGLAVAGLWRHSMNCAALARKIGVSERFSRNGADNVSTAAFLHDIGKLLMANEMPEKYREVSRLVSSENLPSFEAEQQVFGFDHAEAGGFLLSRWKLPTAIVQPVRWHHAPSCANGETVAAVTVVHVTDCLEHELNEAPSVASAVPDQDFLAAVSATASLEKWRELTAGE